MRMEEIAAWAILAVIIVLTVMFVVHFWWLILIVVALFLARAWYVRRKMEKNLETFFDEVEELAEDSTAQTVHMPRQAQGEIIDAEFTEIKEDKL